VTRIKPRTKAVVAGGVSLWLDDLSRDLLDSRRFADYVSRYSVTGATSNPTTFRNALRSRRYEARIAALAGARDLPLRELFFELALADVEEAAELLRPVHERSAGSDGFVSFECTPDVAHDPRATVDQALDLARRLAAHRNTMIKVPATDAGLSAVEELTAAGVNVNVTLLFSPARYEQAVNAFMRGLEQRADAGLRLDHVRSVASFFVSRIDAKADRLLPDRSHLRGRIGILNAKVAYRRFDELFHSPRWNRLAMQGAKVQRPLWASTAPKSDRYRDVLYVEALALPGSVLTVPEATLLAVAHHGRPDKTELLLRPDLHAAEFARASWALDLQALTDELEREGIAAFVGAYEQILERLGEASPFPARKTVPTDGANRPATKISQGGLRDGSNRT
jgi:transaldolase